MISDFEILATKILLKKKVNVNEGLLDSIKDKFARTITEKVQAFVLKSLNKLQQRDPKSAQEIHNIIRTKDTDKLKELFKQHKVPQLILKGFGSTKLQEEGLLDVHKGIFLNIDQFLKEFRETLGLKAKEDCFLETLILFFVLGLCFVLTGSAIGSAIGALIYGPSIEGFREAIGSVLFNDRILIGMLSLIGGGLVVASNLTLSKD